MSTNLDKDAENVHLPRSKCHRIIVCVDELQHSDKVVSYGVIVAKAFDADLTLIHVVESGTTSGRPSDPVTSNLLRWEASIQIEELAQKWADEGYEIHTAVLEGRPGNQICIWAREHQVDLTIISTRQDEPVCDWDVGDTARRVIDCTTGSVLLIPGNVAESETAPCKRILTLLDGSCCAESALPIALRLAETQGAELVLVHAIPELELTNIGPPEPEDEELHRRVIDRNESAARKYLGRIRARLSDEPIIVRTVTLSGGDPRHLLVRAIIDEDADMVVMSSHGRSSHMDMAAGSVASHLMTHTSIPLLIVRNLLDGLGRIGASSPVTSLRFPMREVA